MSMQVVRMSRLGKQKTTGDVICACGQRLHLNVIVQVPYRGFRSADSPIQGTIICPACGNSQDIRVCRSFMQETPNEDSCSTGIWNR